MLHASTAPAIVQPAARAAGRVRAPGDKSISHRYALLAALAHGTSIIHGYSPGADCAATLSCLGGLGVGVHRPGPGVVEITGRGLGGLQPPPGPLDAANSGTTLRLLAGILAAHPFETVIAGDGSLNRRPMARIIAPLERMGARIESTGGRPPLRIHGAALSGITHSPEVPSAQVKSAVLLAGLHASGTTVVVEPVATRDHTERALVVFGARLERHDGRISLGGGQRLEARDLSVPGDISGAAFWMVLAAASPGADVTIEHVGLNPTRLNLMQILRRAGARIECQESEAPAGEPIGHVRVTPHTLRSFTIEPSEVPGVIDEIPALAALGARLPDGQSMEVRGAGELRVKESDRISTLARGLRALGAEVDEYPDGFRITARPLRGATLDSAGDHRIAMTLAVAATGASSPSALVNAGAVDVSYPGFFDELARLTSGDRR